MPTAPGGPEQFLTKRGVKINLQYLSHNAHCIKGLLSKIVAPKAVLTKDKGLLAAIWGGDYKREGVSPAAKGEVQSDKGSYHSQSGVCSTTPVHEICLNDVFRAHKPLAQNLHMSARQPGLQM